MLRARTPAREASPGISTPNSSALLDQAAQTADQTQATTLYQKAQTLLFADLPAIPLWYQNGFGGHSTKVSNVEFGWNSAPLYHAVTKD